MWWNEAINDRMGAWTPFEISVAARRSPFGGPSHGKFADGGYSLNQPMAFERGAQRYLNCY
jgi:hypothetical protein